VGGDAGPGRTVAHVWTRWFTVNQATETFSLLLFQYPASKHVLSSSPAVSVSCYGLPVSRQPRFVSLKT
jgi:hypothetical protein